jgi:hypothetical protein
MSLPRAAIEVDVKITSRVTWAGRVAAVERMFHAVQNSSDFRKTDGRFRE